MRLRKRRDFIRVQRRGERVVLRNLIAIHRPRPRDSFDATSSASAASPVAPGFGHRFGLTVSKKVGNAVVRNRTKRRLREAIRRSARHVLQSDERLSSTDVVFIARPSAAGASYDDLVNQVSTALARIRADVQSGRGGGSTGGQRRRRRSRRDPRSRR